MKQGETITKEMLQGLTERHRCKDCGNAWWFDLKTSWSCSTCGKTHAKNTSEQKVTNDDSK